MAQGGFNNINFKINFQAGDRTAFANLKKELTEMKQLAQSVDFGLDQNSINKVVSTADSIARAMTKAYDPQLNTVNIQKFNNLLKQSGTDIKQVQQNLSTMGASGSNAFMKMTAQLMEINPAIKQTNAFLDDLYKTLFNTVKYTVFNNLLSSISSTIKQSYYYVKDLDTSLNDIRIVTGKSADEMERFAVQANDAAKTLAVSTKAYTEGSLIYYQQGLDDETVKALTDITAKTSNVTGQSMSSVSEQLTAVQNGYRVANEAAEEGMQVYERYVDKMAAVGAATASDLEELSTAMSKVASAASSMGVDFDDLNAQIATIVSVTRQAPESVGTALKTIYARLGDLKVDGVDEFGTKLGEVSSQLQTMGINVIDPLTGDMRDMSSVMAEVAEKQNTQTSAQRQAAAVAMAGKRQYNNLIALFDNQDMYNEALETSMNSAGTLEKQQEIALESLNKKITVLKTTAEDLYDSLFDTKTIGDFVDAGTNLIQFLADFVDGVGGLNNILPLVVFNLTQLFSKQIAAGAESIITNLTRTSDAAALAEQNMRQLELIFADSSFQKGEGAGGRVGFAFEQGQGQLNNLFQQMGQYQSIMNEQEKQNYDLLLKQQIAVNEQRNNLAEMVDTLVGIHDEYGLINKDTLENVENSKKQSENATAISKVIESLQHNLDRLNTANENDKLNNFTFRGDTAGGNDTLNFGKMNDESLVKQMTHLRDEIGLTDEVYRKLIKTIDTSSYENAKSSLERLIGALTETKKASEQVAQESGNIEIAQERISNFANAMSEQIDLRKVVENTTQAVSALGRLAMSINTIKNLGSIQNNDDLSMGEKFLQTIMNISFALPGLTSAFATFRKIFNFSSIVDIVNTKLAAHSAALAANTAAEAQYYVAKSISNTADKNRLVALTQLITKEQLEAVATGKMTAADYAHLLIENKTITAYNRDIPFLEKEIALRVANAKATNTATVANEAFNASMIKSPIGIAILAFTALIGILAAVENHYKKVAEAAKETAEESKKVADELNTETQAHNQLVEEFEELNQQYKDGLIEKEALQDTTNKLVEAYGLELNIIDSLTGNYDALAEAARQAREEEEKEALIATKRAIQDSGQAINANKKEIAHKGYFTQGLVGGQTLGENTASHSADQYNNRYEDIAAKQQEIFGNIDADRGYQYGNTAGDYVDTVKKIDEYIDFLENEIKLDRSHDQIQALLEERKNITSSSEYQNAESNVENYKKQLADFAHLEGATSQEDFDSRVEDLRDQLSQAVEDHLIDQMSDEEINQFIMKTVSKINTGFSQQFQIENTLFSKFDEALGSKLENKLKDRSPELAKALITSGFDLSNMSDAEIDKLLDNLQTSIENDPDAVVSIPAAFQLDINDKILGGKDIAKGDQETLLASNPQAESILGDRDTFNNKSVGERIALMQELNALTLQQNKYAIEHYDILEKTNKALIAEADAEIERKTAEVDSLTEKLKDEQTTQEEREKIKEQIKDLQNEIIQLTDKKYELKIDLDMESVSDNLIQSMVGDVLTTSDQIKAAAESIGEGWKVAAENVSTFAAAFPELMSDIEEVNRLEDGSIQLNKEHVNTILENKQAEIKANKEATISAIDDKLKQLRLEQEFQDEKARILREYLESENRTEEGAQKALDGIKEAGKNYETALREAGLIEEAEAMNKSQETAGEGVSGLVEILGSVDEAINVIHSNFAKMLTEDELDAYNISVKSGRTVSSKTINAVNPNRDEISSDQFDFLSQALADAEARSSEIAKQIASYEGFRSELMKDVSEMDNAANRVKKGLAGKEDKSKSGSSKKDKDKDQKEQEDEFDRYWEIKKAIDAVDQALKKLDKDKQNLYGYELINALKQENELLEQQAANYNTLYEMQQQEAAELREQLGAMGLMFDASGAITNYAAATSAALQQYAAAIEQYNAGLIDETTLKVYEKAYENFKKLLERYDKLYYTEMQQTQEKLDEIRRKELANNLKAWEVEIQIHLDKEKMKRDQNDFLKDIKQDFRKVFSDLTIDVKYDEKNFKSLVNDVQTTTKAIDDVKAEIDKMMAGGDSTMFESVSQAQEKLKELQEQLLDQGKALRELYKQVQETYLNGIDQVKDQFDELMSRYEKFNDELEFHKELIELLYGDKAYDLMDKYYETQTKNIEAQIESLRKQADFQQSEFQKSYETAIKSGSKVDIDDFTTQTEDMKKAYENMIEAQGNLNDLVLEGVKILQDQYLNSINKIMDAMDKNVQGRDGFEGMKENWEFMQKMADEYLDAVEGAAKIQTFANKMDMDKVNANSLKAQQKIQAFREKEIKALREKENLTQADIDLAEARYQIMLKEIALEDAQNNKTSMKLTRNEQGNQSYQYVADEDDVGQKQQDLLQSYADLYKLADDSYNHSMELAFDLYEEMNEKIRAIYEEHKDDPELAYQLALEIQEQYLPQIEAAAGNSELYKQEAMWATAGVFQTICDQDETAYDTLTQKQKDLVDSLRDKNFEDYDDMRTHLIEGFYPDLNTITEEVFKNMNINSQTTAAAVINQQVKDPGSVKNEVNKAVSAMQRAIQEYEKELDKLQQIADMDFSKIGESIDKVSQKIDDMDGTTDKMVNNSSQYLDELRRALEAIADKQNSVIEQILAAQRAMQEYINLAAQARAAANAGSGSNTGGSSTSPVGGDNGSGDNGNKTSEGPGGNRERFGIIAQDGHHNVDTRIDSAGEKGLTLDEAHNLYNSNKMRQGTEGLSNFRFWNLDKNAGFPAYRTGGYTGEQGNDGRLAILHQKELVLNETDTANFLEGISMIRDMTALNGTISDAITGAVANMILALGGFRINTAMGTVTTESNASNIQNITAEFPNANDVNEIREAILNLPNLASQMVTQNQL